MSTYVISDLHGEYEKFKKMLELIDFTDNDEMYILGDVIDRGEHPIKLLLSIMGQENIHMILGNHEQMMLNYYKTDDPTLKDLWECNGGYTTIYELDKCGKFTTENILEYLRGLKPVKILHVNGNKFYLAHADLETKQGVALSAQSVDYILWNRREPSYDDILTISQYLITGHTPTMHFGKEGKIFNHENWYCIDCGAVFGGNLGCLRLDDMEEFYV